jgi:two-component system response regulator HydG
VRGGKPPRPHLPMGIRPLKEALAEPEKRIIIQALQAFHWNRQETARVLDINRTTLYKKMKSYGLLIEEAIWTN